MNEYPLLRAIADTEEPGCSITPRGNTAVTTIGLTCPSLKAEAEAVLAEVARLRDEVCHLGADVKSCEAHITGVDCSDAEGRTVRTPEQLSRLVEMIRRS